MAAIELTQVSKRYPPDFYALQRISFKIKAGEILTVGGHSGAGKSTLIKIIAAVERPSSGVVIIGRQNLSTLSRQATPFFRRNIGLIMQNQCLLFDRNALANVMLPLSIAGFSPKEGLRRAQAALDKVGLLHKANSMPITLSCGQQQRLAIARAVAGRPGILIADEPTAHLDTRTAADVARIFQDFNQVGITVIIASCDNSLLPQGRYIELRQGRLSN